MGAFAVGAFFWVPARLWQCHLCPGWLWFLQCRAVSHCPLPSTQSYKLLTESDDDESVFILSGIDDKSIRPFECVLKSVTLL